MSLSNGVRKIRTIFFLVMSAVTFCTSSGISAENSVPRGVTLQDVLVDITRTNPSILEAMEHYRSIVAERDIASSEYLPTVGTSLSAGPERTKGVPTDDVEMNLTTKTATLYARQNVFKGFGTNAYVDETDARIKAAAFDVLAVANAVYLETAEAYINVVRTKELLKIAEQNAYTQEQIMRQVREKTDAGFNKVSELYNSESRLALSKGSFISRQQDLNQALARFHRQFGRLLEPEQFVAPEPAYVAPATIGETVDVAFENHPALKVAKYNIQTRQYTVEKAKAAYWPTLDLELQGQYRNDTGGEEGDTTQTGAYLTLNYIFWDGGARSGVKERDQLQLRKERRRQYVERRNVNESVRLAWNIMEAENAKKQYLVEHMMLSAKTLSAFKEEYYVGRRTLLDLLNMENEYTDAKLSLTDSDYSYLVALYRLMQATGILLDEHDTGLREILQLPKNKAEDLEGYEDEESNYDQDRIEDTTDQCDNTNDGGAVEDSGCHKSYINVLGYPRDQDLLLTPYITPMDSQQVTEYVQASAALDSEVNSKKGAMQKVILPARPNSDYVTDDGLNQLAVVAQSLINDPTATVLVEGYIASDTSSDENIMLSEKRAALVKEYLMEHGLDASRITVVGRGNENPIAGNDTAEGRRQNRRVEVTVFTKP